MTSEQAVETLRELRKDGRLHARQCAAIDAVLARLGKVETEVIEARRVFGDISFCTLAQDCATVLTRAERAEAALREAQEFWPEYAQKFPDFQCGNLSSREEDEEMARVQEHNRRGIEALEALLDRRAEEERERIKKVVRDVQREHRLSTGWFNCCDDILRRIDSEEGR